ncbi:SDR family oxidoreductase [Streptomyces rishiriensis]|uniref:SDR family oxidoreductase n=1 Tax=Streptomyces rishiriensis TaxID=68264 RepID=UPI001FE7AE24|nr:NAD(P)H-binding protein [Streptomyces rishiriensis]
MPNRARTCPALSQLFAADLTDPKSLLPAFDGVGQVFLYAHHEGVHGVIAAARTAGVERIVLMSSGSVIHPSSRGNAITEEHREVEEAFRAASDLMVVPIRPLVLATNALGWASPIKTSGTRHRCGCRRSAARQRRRHRSPDRPARISQRDQAHAIADATGRDIAVDGLTREAALARFARFMQPVEAEAVLQFLDDAAAGNSPATDTLEGILGRPASGFDVWAADHAADFSVS